MIDTINNGMHAAETTLDAALDAHQTIPAQLPLAEVNPDQQVLDTETKLIHHAIRTAAFNPPATRELREMVRHRPNSSRLGPAARPKYTPCWPSAGSADD
jgi:hypothetical protein